MLKYNVKSLATASRHNEDLVSMRKPNYLLARRTCNTASR